MATLAAPSGLSVPPFVTVTHVGETTGAEAYPISNEASGKHFTANAATVAFLESLRSTGSSTAATRAAGLRQEAAEALLGQFMRFGVAVQKGVTNTDSPRPSQPLELR